MAHLGTMRTRRGQERNEGQEHSNSVINLISIMLRITVTNAKITTVRSGHKGITLKLRRGREGGANHPQIRSASYIRSMAISSEQSILTRSAPA